MAVKPCFRCHRDCSSTALFSLIHILPDEILSKPVHVFAILFGTIRIPGHFPLWTGTTMVSLKEAPHVSGINRSNER
jgi:hypothetical protein